MRPSEARWKATAVYHRTCLDDDRVNRRARNYVTFGARPNVGVLRLLSKQLRIDRFTDADGVGDHHPPAGAAWRAELPGLLGARAAPARGGAGLGEGGGRAPGGPAVAPPAARL